jgi:hypothetical protein
MKRYLFIIAGLVTVLLVFSQNNQADSTLIANKSVEALIKRADSYLNDSKVYSVVLKRQVSPAGSKHDYMSLAPYWFPDTSKENGLPYVRRDGERNPEEKEYPDKKNLNVFCKQVIDLSYAYKYTKKTEYAQKAQKLLRVWFIDTATCMNPNLNYAQFIKGRNDGRGAGIVDTRVFADLLDAVTVLNSSGGLDEYTNIQLQDWFSKYFKWLVTSSNGKKERVAKNNHGSWFAWQYFRIAKFIGKEDSAQAILKTINDRIAWQIDPDGKQPLELVRTKSLSYSLFNLLPLCLLAKNASEDDLWKFETKDGRSIKRACDYVLPYAMKPETWQGKQIKEIDKEQVCILVRILAKQYPENKQYQIWKSELEKEFPTSLYNLIY